MSVTDLLFNKVAVSIYVIGMSLLIYCELRTVFGIILIGAAFIGGITLFLMLANEALAYVLIYGGYGFLLSVAEWTKHRKRK